MAEKSADTVQLSRRQAMALVGAGVVAAGGAVAVTAVEANALAQGQADQQIQALNSQLAEQKKNLDAAQQQLDAAQHEITKHQQQLDAAQQEIAKHQQQLVATQLQLEMYKGLTALYETLEGVGIDTVIGAALGAYKATLDSLAGGVDALKAGIVTAENALDSFEQAFASVRDALTAAETAWANVNALLKNAQELIKDATSPLLPFVDQARRFFDDLLGKIPFGGGESARQTINGIVGLMVGVPDALDKLENGLFRTLREGWFNEDNARNLEATLSKPIVQGVLEPTRKFLDQVDITLKAWEAQVSTPVNKALAQRQIVRQQIDEYKKKNGL